MSAEGMASEAGAWLLLITNLPGRNQTLRMRLWRALKAAGAGLLKDGVYVLPNSPLARRLFDEHAKEIGEGGGTGHILSVNSDSERQTASLQKLFDRTAEYAELGQKLTALKRDFSRLPEAEARQQLAALRREVATLAGRDFFPGKPREQIEGAVEDAEAALNARFAPDEPRAAHEKIKRRDRKDYRGRTWATRERLWIDRVASAWLIRRFIDPEARFVWLTRIKDCPKKALGFDFDGAEFTHVDSKVTFEVLIASFGLEHDAGLARIGALVHYLDIGGIPVAEAPGFASIMAGARTLQTDDDALLKWMTPTLDSLYAAYANPAEGD
jgi:nucleotide-binding universal stress UspA family protein